MFATLCLSFFLLYSELGCLPPSVFLSFFFTRNSELLPPSPPRGSELGTRKCGAQEALCSAPKMVARFCKWLPKLTRIFIISLDFKDYNKQGELQWTTACKAKNGAIHTKIWNQQIQMISRWFYKWSTNFKSHIPVYLKIHKLWPQNWL